MQQAINIVLDLQTAAALQKLTGFVESTTSGLKQLAAQALASYVSIEGLRRLADVERDALALEEQIGRLSKTTGVSVAAIVALRDAAVATGTPFEAVGTALGKFSQQVYEASTNGGRAADAFQQMGVELLNSDGSLRATDAILKDFLVSFAKMPDGPQKVAMAMDISGRNAREAIPFFNEAAQAMEQMGEASPINEESVAQATTFNRTIRELSEAVEMLFVEVANKLLPSFIDLANKFLESARAADSNAAALTGLIGVLKGLITAAAIAAAVIYDIGKALGDVAGVWVENFKVAFQTVRFVIQDVTHVLKDQVNVLIDVGNGLIAVVTAQHALMTGHIGEAKTIISSAFGDIKDDFKSLAGDLLNVPVDVGQGALRMLDNTNSVSVKYIDDVKKQWSSLSDWLSNLWGGASQAPSITSPKASAPIFPASSLNIRNLTTLQSILGEIYKQDEKLIQNDPFKSQGEKVAELIPLLAQEKEIVISQYDAAQKALMNPNLDEMKRLELLRDIVKLQGQLNDLEAKERDTKIQGDFVGQMQAGLIKLNDRITDFSGNSAQLALKSMQSAVDAVGSSIYQAMIGTKNWGEAFGRAMAQAAQGIVQMVTQYIAGKLAMMAVDAVYSSESKSESASSTAASVPAGIAKAGEQGGWVGILIYVGVFLAAMAALMAIASAVGRESGGPVTSGMPYIVGEKRPELFVPDQSGRIMPEVPTMSAGTASGGSNTQVHLAFHGGEAAAQKWAESQDGQSFLVDTNKRSVRRVSKT